MHNNAKMTKQFQLLKYVCAVFLAVTYCATIANGVVSTRLADELKESDSSFNLVYAYTRIWIPNGFLLLVSLVGLINVLRAKTFGGSPLCTNVFVAFVFTGFSIANVWLSFKHTHSKHISGYVATSACCMTTVILYFYLVVANRRNQAIARVVWKKLD